MIHPILHSPNKILSTPSSTVDDPSAPSIKSLIEDMKDTVVSANGIGFAAPQIGQSLRVIVINHQKELYAVINPEITWRASGKSFLEEGCLSVPDVFVKVARPKEVIVTGIDENGNAIEIKAKDMLAKIFQHEIDHINGILISNYL
jgi:peptide deformylase